MPIHKDVIIYKLEPLKKFRWISYLTLGQALIVGVNIIFLPKERDKQTLKAPAKQQSEFVADDTVLAVKNSTGDCMNDLLSWNNIKDNFKTRPVICWSMITTSILISLGLTIYARRTAHMITLLPGNRVRFSSFSPLGSGSPPVVELPLTDVSCVSGRMSQNYSILKFRGYFGYHLVNTEGKFVHPKLYDENLGYKRSWLDK